MSKLLPRLEQQSQYLTKVLLSYALSFDEGDLGRQQLLFITGKTGCGKTCVLHRIAELVSSKSRCALLPVKDQEPVTILELCGSTLLSFFTIKDDVTSDSAEAALSRCNTFIDTQIMKRASLAQESSENKLIRLLLVIDDVSPNFATFSKPRQLLVAALAQYVLTRNQKKITHTSCNMLVAVLATLNCLECDIKLSALKDKQLAIVRYAYVAEYSSQERDSILANAGLTGVITGSSLSESTLAEVATIVYLGRYTKRVNKGFRNLKKSEHVGREKLAVETEHVGYNDLKRRLQVFLACGKEGGLKGYIETCGILLYGPSGCGKSILAQSEARRANRFCVRVKITRLLSKYFGDTEASVREIFAKARRAAPSIVLIDEVEYLCAKRGAVNK